MKGNWSEGKKNHISQISAEHLNLVINSLSIL